MPKNSLTFLKNQLNAMIISICFILLLYYVSLLLYPVFRDDGYYKYDLLILFIILYSFYCEAPHVYKLYGITYISGEFLISVIFLISMGIFLFFVDHGGSKFYVTGNYQFDFLVLCFGLHVLFRGLAIVFSREPDAE